MAKIDKMPRRQLIALCRKGDELLKVNDELLKVNDELLSVFEKALAAIVYAANEEERAAAIKKAADLID